MLALRADDANRRSLGTNEARAPPEQSAAADAENDRLDARTFGEDLQRHGALAGQQIIAEAGIDVPAAAVRGERLGRVHRRIVVRLTIVDRCAKGADPV